MQAQFATIPDIPIRVGVHLVSCQHLFAICWADIGPLCRVNSIELRRRPQNGTFFVKWPSLSDSSAAVYPAPELANRVKELILTEYHRLKEVKGGDF